MAIQIRTLLIKESYQLIGDLSNAKVKPRVCSPRSV